MSAENKVPAIRFLGFGGEWEERALGEILKLGSSKRVHREDYVSSGVPFFRGLEISKLGKSTKLEGVLYISKESYIQLKESFGVPQVGDILITAVGTLGNSFLVSNTEPFYFKDGNLIWLSEIKINNEYLNTYIGNGLGQQRILNSAAGSNQKALTMVNLKNVIAIFPCEKEQTKIGNYFQQLDTLIAQHQQKHDKLLNLKKSLLEKMFPKQGATVPEIRFKGFSGEWAENALRENADFSKGQGYSKSDLVAEGIPIILYGRLYTRYQTVIHEVDTFSIEYNKSIFSNGNEVVVPASGESAEDISRASAVVQSGVLLGGDLNIIYPSNKLDSIFLALTLSNGKPQKDLSRRAQGKSVVHLRNNDLKEVDISFPDITEQTKIGNLFNRLDTLLTQHQAQLKKLNNIKQACLEKMFV